MTITYLLMKDNKYHIGTALDIQEAVRISVQYGSQESYYLHGNAEKAIRETDPKKMFNLIRIVDRKKY